jgi:glucose-6-phosphate 1-epimerase
MSMTFDLPPSVQLGPGRNGLPRLTVSTARATGEVYLHGAQVTAWRPSGADPVIWVSRDSQFQADKPIRGGVPICFPWFGAHASDASAPMHGFARLSEWTLAGAEDRGGEVHLTYLLTHDGTSHRSAWPHPFKAEYRVTVGERLAMALDVTNTGDAPVTFEA